ncbi:MAG: tetratricopeptide repeat protein [Pikeienuella sp.]
MRPPAPAFAMIFSLLAGPAFAQAFDYETCLNLTTVDPQQARAEAIAGFANTGDFSARHCEALALAEIGANRSAAEILQETAQAYEMEDAQRAELLLQAARQWREYGRPDAARGALNSGLVYHKTTALFIERASLSAEESLTQSALDDLNAALALDPKDGEAMALRAAAKRRLGDEGGAYRDAQKAVELRPVSPSAWLELGKSEKSRGDKNAARRAWLKAIDVAPSSKAAALARGELQDMDGGG